MATVGNHIDAQAELARQELEAELAPRFPGCGFMLATKIEAVTDEWRFRLIVYDATRHAIATVRTARIGAEAVLFASDLAGDIASALRAAPDVVPLIV